MEGGVLSEVVLPMAIFLIMVSIGMALTVDDFRRMATTLAITIAISVLDSNLMAVIPGLYGVWMLVTGFAAAGVLARGRRRHPAPPGVHRVAPG